MWDFNSPVPALSLGGRSALGDTGIATLSCSTITCGNGDTFALSYSAHNSDPSNGYGKLLFAMEFSGTVSAVPVPSAAWLFGSGLLYIAALNRRRQFNTK